MSIDLMREFSVLSTTGSLSEASRALHVSQPTLSRHLESLENIVGTKLISRSNAGVSLTPAGNAFLEDSLEIVASFDAAVERAREIGATSGQITIGGHFRIVSIGNLASFSIAVIRRRHPGIDARLYDKHDTASHSELATYSATKTLRSGAIDVAIIPFCEAEHPDYEVTSLYNERFDVYVPADDPIASAKNVQLEDLRHMTFTFTQSYRHMTEAVLAACRRKGFEPKTKIRVNEYTPQFATAIPNCVISWPESTRGRMVDSSVSGLARVDLVDPEAYLNICVVSRKGNDAKSDLRRKVVEDIVEATRLTCQSNAAIFDSIL